MTNWPVRESAFASGSAVHCNRAAIESEDAGAERRVAAARAVPPVSVVPPVIGVGVRQVSAPLRTGEALPRCSPPPLSLRSPLPPMPHGAAKVMAPL